ncbi:MAG: AtpZ/AtpI family protein [Methyloceanibacter sp.]
MAGAENESGRHQDDRDAQDIRRRLDDLEGRLGQARGRHAPPLEPENRGRAFGQALRLSTEMVVGVVVGGFIGWVLDGVFGSTPFLMVVFLLLGMAAGILNAVRTAKRMQAEAPAPKDLRPVDDDDDD